MCACRNILFFEGDTCVLVGAFSVLTVYSATYFFSVYESYSCTCCCHGCHLKVPIIYLRAIIADVNL